MAWNEPNGNKDPWGRKSSNKSELDNALNDLNKYFKSLLGGTSGGSGSNKKNTSIIGVVILTVYLLSGIYIVNDGERGVVLQFGEFSTITMPGTSLGPKNNTKSRNCGCV